MFDIQVMGSWEPVPKVGGIPDEIIIIPKFQDMATMNTQYQGPPLHTRALWN